MSGRAGISPSRPLTRWSSCRPLLTGDSTGWTLALATDINNRWQIVGSGLDPSGRNRAYLAMPVWVDGFNSLPGEDSSFTGTGDLGNWVPSGSGVADVVTDPDDPGNFVMSLTTGSPVVVELPVSTPGSAFAIAFDFRFLSEFGTLSVSLAGSEAAVIAAPGVPQDAFAPYSVMIDRSDLMNLDNVPLTIGLTGPTGSRVLIDNIALTTGVPEPATGQLLLLTFILLATKRRRRFRRAIPVRP